MLSRDIFGVNKAGEIRPAAGADQSPLEPVENEKWRGNGLWWQRILRIGRGPARRLRLCESLTLGERRFVAVIEFEQSRFLVGGTSTSLVLLAHLNRAEGSANRSPLEAEPMSRNPISQGTISAEEEL